MKRRYELDLCRICACFMVVMLHVAATGWYIDPSCDEWRVFNFADTSVRAGVPLFFMISGSLFLERDNLDIKRFLTKNVLRLIIIFIVWGIIYELNNQRMYHSYENAYELLVESMKGHYHLWFIPAMVIVYLFLPVVHSAMKGNRINVYYLLFLFIFLTLLSTNLLLVPDLPVLFQTICEKVNLAHISYLGYMIVGYILSRKKYNKKVMIIMPVIYFLITILTAYGNRWYSLKEGEAIEWLYGYFTLPVFFQACCIFVFFQCFRDVELKHLSMIKFISDCTLGIYLLHPMILEYWNRHNFSVSDFNPVLSVPCVFLLVTCECLIVVAVMKSVPWVKKIV